LVAERQAVLEAILELNHFPAGMELFPASDSTPWQAIERIIDDSDYYVLVIGGKYGSTDARGISYTEREYDYAVSKGKPVLPFLHGDPDEIPAGKTEIQEDARAKLDAFRNKVQKHLCKYWTSPQELKTHVVVSLTWQFLNNPGVGWIRAGGDKETPEEILAETYLQIEFDAVGLGNQTCKEKERSLNLHQRKKSAEYFARLCCEYRQSALDQLTEAISTRGDLRASIEEVRRVINDGYDGAVRILEAKQADREAYRQQLNDAAQRLWTMATRIHSHAEPLASKE